MSYTHLSIIERSKLEMLHQQGKSARAIAKDMPPLAENCAETQPKRPYHAGPSQESYVQRRQASIPAGKWTRSCLIGMIGLQNEHEHEHEHEHDADHACQPIRGRCLKLPESC